MSNEQHPRILFLHGASLGGWMWQDIIKLLPEFDCIPQDLPAHNAKSETDYFSLDAAISNASELIHYARDRKFHIVGISLGGLVGLELLRSLPDRFERALLSSPSLGPLPGGDVLSKLSRPMTWLSTRDFAIRQTANQLALPDHMMDSFTNSMHRMTPNLFRRINTTIHEYRLSEAHQQIAHPILLTYGEKEPNFVKNNMRLIQTQVQAGTLRQIDGAGHGWCFEKPQLFADTVREWFTNTL